MKFDTGVSKKYRQAVAEAVETILEKGNERHRATARALSDSDLLIRVVPLSEIGVSGVTGLIDGRETNRKIRREQISVGEALSEVYITFSNWTFDVAGQRGVEGTLVHEGLHACDFAEIIASLSSEGREFHDLSLYDLEHRAAITSAEYLVLIGKEDYVEEGRQLGLVGVDDTGRPFVDMAGIEARMRNDYKINSAENGGMMSERLGLRRQGRVAGLLSYLGI